MWPFSAAKGRIGTRHDVDQASTGEIASAAGSVSTARLTPDIADGAAIWSKRLTDLFLYWQGKRNGRHFPSRADIDPLDIPSLLPVVFLVDVKGEPVDFRFRLVGSEFARKYGTDMTGRTLGEVNRHAHSGAILKDYAVCAEEGVPLASRNSFINDQGIYWRYERILMPLGDEAGRVQMILGGMDINIPLSELSRLETVQRNNLTTLAESRTRAR